MKNRTIGPMLKAIIAAALFGASAPLSKLLLGEIPPTLMASFLYLGSGAFHWAPLESLVLVFFGG